MAKKIATIEYRETSVRDVVQNMTTGEYHYLVNGAISEKSHWDLFGCKRLLENHGVKVTRDCFGNPTYANRDCYGNLIKVAEEPEEIFEYETVFEEKTRLAKERRERMEELYRPHANYWNNHGNGFTEQYETPKRWY